MTTQFERARLPDLEFEGHRPLRVLLVIGTARIGGVETFVRGLARQIDQSRFHITVCAMDASKQFWDDLLQTGVTVHPLRKGVLSKYLSFFWYVRSGSFDILHVNVGGLLLRCLARLAGCRSIISHVHNLGDKDLRALLAEKRSFLLKTRKGFMIGSDWIVACSDAVRRSLVTCSPDYADRIQVIYSGVDTSRFRPMALNCIKDDTWRKKGDLFGRRPVIGFVGRIVPQKGLIYLIEAVRILSNDHRRLRVLVVGDGWLSDSMKTLAASCNGDAFRFVGQQQDIEKIIPLCDVIVVPSEWEPFGIICIEAMAAGRPVVAFDIDGINETVLHGETGLLVKHRDSVALAKAIDRLAGDERLSKRMGLAGRSRVEKRFNVSDMAVAFERLYVSVATARLPRGSIAKQSRVNHRRS